MHYLSINRNAWVRIMKISSLQIMLAIFLTNVNFAFDGNAQEILNRRVSISA